MITRDGPRRSARNYLPFGVLQACPPAPQALPMFARPGAAQLRSDPDLVRQQVRLGHASLDASAAVWLPKTAFPKAWPVPVRLYVHALLIEDITVQSVLRGSAPLYTWLWPSPAAPAAATLRQYARAVHGSTDAYLARLTPDGWSQVLDLSKLDLGQRTVAWVIRRFVLIELAQLVRAISNVAAPASTRVAHDPSRRRPGRSSARRSPTLDVHKN